MTRRGRPRFRDRSGGTRPSWSAKAERALAGEPSGGTGRFWIDSRIDWPRYDRISWRDVPAALGRDPGRFRGRLVLVGGEFLGSGDDYHRVPQRGGGTAAVSGLTLQALLADTLARGRPVREPGRTAVLAVAAALTGLAIAGILCARRDRAAVAWLAGLAAVAGLYVALSSPAFARAGLVLPVSSPLGLALPGCLLAWACRRAQGQQGLQGRQGLEGKA